MSLCFARAYKKRYRRIFVLSYSFCFERDFNVRIKSVNFLRLFGINSMLFLCVCVRADFGKNSELYFVFCSHKLHDVRTNS